VPSGRRGATEARERVSTDAVPVAAAG
jgi:hypothetical protein